MRIGVCGTGKAGKEMIMNVIKHNNHELAMVINRATSNDIGKDVGDLIDGKYMNMDVISIEEAVSKVEEKKVDVIVDFSGKETSVKLLELMTGKKINFVICTTNFNNDQWSDFMKNVKYIDGSVVYASTLTVGINLLISYAARLSKVLPDFDFEIIERHKAGKPRPTTTAKKISEAINRGQVHISSVRLGGYVGVHELTAANEVERITVIHESFSREAFAHGALIAAEFGYGKRGYYEMKDVIAEMERKALGE
ncbi:4-hydroxy-tetrahydrodipicolinate reductase [Butyrivibrio sp. LB2008]|uniref:4-hydroxy-tetrahydrodipicolinate reductase n=1 Tax=Butyrivibrio sp. LB2008 TaxID=1408305 RepID=UPI00047B7DA3|nr:dihydrodipicolinate reductase C-terminal domain-containing protein [Butyrivibrio sp. LB2008]